MSLQYTQELLNSILETCCSKLFDIKNKSHNLNSYSTIYFECRCGKGTS